MNTVSVCLFSKWYRGINREGVCVPVIEFSRFVIMFKTFFFFFDGSCLRPEFLYNLGFNFFFPFKLIN